MSASRWVHLEDCDVLRETDAAFLVKWNDRQEWIPKSQMSDPDQVEPGDEGVTVTITEWFANVREFEVD